MHNPEHAPEPSIETKQLLSALRSEGRFDSEGSFTVDLARQHERAWEEAGSVKGALSDPGFELIQQSVTAILKELDRLNQTVAWNDDSGQDRIDIQRRTELRAVATAWADRLVALIVKLNQDLRVRDISKLSYWFSEPKISDEQHQEYGRDLAALASVLDDYGSEQQRDSHRPSAVLLNALEYSLWFVEQLVVFGHGAADRLEDLPKKERTVYECYFYELNYFGSRRYHCTLNQFVDDHPEFGRYKRPRRDVV